MAGAIRQLGFAQVSAGQPGPELEAHGLGVRGHFLLASPRSRNSRGRDDGRAGSGGALGQGALCGHLELLTGSDRCGGEDSARTGHALPDSSDEVFDLPARAGKRSAGCAGAGGRGRHRLYSAGAGTAYGSLFEGHSCGLARYQRKVFEDQRHRRRQGGADSQAAYAGRAERAVAGADGVGLGAAPHDFGADWSQPRGADRAERGRAG